MRGDEDYREQGEDEDVRNLGDTEHALSDDRRGDPYRLPEYYRKQQTHPGENTTDDPRGQIPLHYTLVQLIGIAEVLLLNLVLPEQHVVVVDTERPNACQTQYRAYDAHPYYYADEEAENEEVDYDYPYAAKEPVDYENIVVDHLPDEVAREACEVGDGSLHHFVLVQAVKQLNAARNVEQCGQRVHAVVLALLIVLHVDQWDLIAKPEYVGVFAVHCREQLLVLVFRIELLCNSVVAGRNHYCIIE